jgi:hypothetical protein
MVVAITLVAPMEALQAALVEEASDLEERPTPRVW